MAVIKEDNSDASSNSNTQYTISLGDVFQGTLDPVRDRDWIRVELTSGTVYAISPDGLGQWLRYQVFDSQGQQVQRLPNPFPSFAIPPPGSKFIFDPPVSGTYYIQVYAFRPDENDGNPIIYEVSVDENTIPVGTYDDLADYLTDGFWGGRRRAYDVTSGGELTANITGLTEKGQQLARWALEAWSNVTGIKFEFVDDDSAHISFDDNRPGGNAGSSVIDGVIASSHVNVDVRWITNNLALGSYDAFLHEIGHALGLGHPGPYPGEGHTAYGLSNIFLIDSDQATLMSYFTNQENTYIYANKAIYVTPMIADIIAIQNLYGVPNDINAGDTIYGYHSNVGGFLEQFFAQWTGEDNPFFNITPGRNSTIDFVDLDDDGDPDIVVNSGRFRYFENIGTVASPEFIERTSTDNPFSNISGNRGSLTFADLNGDGDADFIVGGRSLRYFENMGTVANPEFMQRTGATNPLDAIESENGSMPLLVDLDSDSDIDLIVGYEDGTFDYFENTGIPTSPEFTQRTGLENPFNGIAIGNGSFPTIVDFDDDNDSDLVVLVPVGGNIYRYFENTGTVFSPSFTERTGTDNPFEKIFDSPYGAPSFVDIHGDGDLDHVVTSSIGNIIYIENIGASTNSDFAIRSLRNNFVGLTLYDNGGIDTLDLSTDTDDQVIDLHQEGISNVYGLIGNLVIARDTVIENYVAGSGNDAITGNEADNVLEGRAGADTLDGGEGSDTAAYDGSEAPVTVNLGTNTATGGDAQGDTFTSIENLSGSAFEDTLTGDAGNNILEGAAGADVLDGGDGLDTAAYTHSNAAVTVNLLNGTNTGGHAAGDTFAGIENVSGSRYNDTLTGDAKANRLDGGSGHDRLTGGAGADVLVGGPGNDAAYYASSAAAVTVNLLDGTGTGGDAEGDTLDSIENLSGSAFEDSLTGNAGNNVLSGRAGADTLDGGDGIDTVSYSGSRAGVTVRLLTGAGERGDAEGDRLSNIENLIGSRYKR